ncbi:CBM35 domain-containing protein [Streptomyces sp. NBC_01244]|uniref:CBM35 domain-containing protein n=1 Tax=Streptomyces sp. NBC_01244 TaxID=2903797 RepID=UPI002E11ABD9|nr:carbohydrate-binding protein [Streptomyces sp. NBC_01244]
MTTPANHGPNNGANKPEDDDPFGYLYEDGQAAGATPPGQGGGYGYPGPTAGGQPGVPRTSYNQVRTVGDRPYGGPRGPVPYQQGPQQQPPAYQAQYQAPEALQAGGYGVPPQQQPPQYTQSLPLPGSGGGRGGGHGGGGSSRKGMLIAAVAVVAAVAIGISAAVIFGKDDDADKGKNTANTGQSPSAPAQNTPSGKPSDSAPADAPLPKGDAGGSGMVISGGAALESAVPGAKSEGGKYVGGFNQPGAAVTWTLEVPKTGEYTFRMYYGVPGKDANMTLAINDTVQTRPINMKNFAKAGEGAWDKGWTNTYSYVNLKQGTNTIKISCEAGNSCEAVIDRFVLEKR